MTSATPPWPLPKSSSSKGTKHSLIHNNWLPGHGCTDVCVKRFNQRTGSLNAQLSNNVATNYRDHQFTLRRLHPDSKPTSFFFNRRDRPLDDFISAQAGVYPYKLAWRPGLLAVPRLPGLKMHSSSPCAFSWPLSLTTAAAQSSLPWSRPGFVVFALGGQFI